VPLYNRIRRFRIERRITLAQLAQSVECDLGFLWRQEMQRVPTPDALKLRLSLALGVPIGELFFQTEPEAASVA